MYHPIKRTKCCVKPDELVTLIKKHYLDKTKTVKYQTTDGSEVSHITYSFEAKLKDCEVPINFVVILGKWNKDDVTDVTSSLFHFPKITTKLMGTSQSLSLASNEYVICETSE